MNSLNIPRKVKIIAEIGINHNGSLNTAKELIDQAFKSGVEMIKFQYRNVEKIYHANHREIGDEILEYEIKRCYISAGSIVLLANYAKELGVKEVGISFFQQEDILDFGVDISIFDFFKIPSPEFDNIKLINSLVNTGKMVFISTGAQTEPVVEKVLKSIVSGIWNPFHCISNYPTKMHNARLGYITYLANKYGRDVGYSSHDEDWRICLFAMSLGVKWIERHITIDKGDIGLDHATSSTPEEFRELVQFACSSALILSGNGPRLTNQGELLNLQNLGRSYYFTKDHKAGQFVAAGDLVYRSPAVGERPGEVDRLLKIPLLENVRSGDVLSESLFRQPKNLRDSVIKYAKHHRLALPVRFHDIEEVREKIAVKSFELHLSCEELNSQFNLNLFKSDESYSIHIPDYISSTELIDPFSKDYEIKERSLKVFARVKTLANSLYVITGQVIPVVSSLSKLSQTKADFYKSCKELTSAWSQDDQSSFLTLQTLPPFAWYFGGSVAIDVFSSPDDWMEMIHYQIPITLDLSHLMMSCNFFQYPIIDALDKLLPITKHAHLSLASGLDGEGVDFSNPSTEEIAAVNRIISLDCAKVIEVWQGHLNRFQGFKKALDDLYMLKRKIP